MNKQLKYERPKLVELTSNEWNVGYGASPSKGCTGGNYPRPFVCSDGFEVGKIGP
jgi:hypothetical protein